MIYEHEYETKVSDYGCIQHNNYSFLGASPDGINDNILYPLRYGRMLEIKNIVNREITGIPKKEYWIQMQLQMETCNLNECDFLETRFTEYDNETDFLEDSIDFFTTKKCEHKGIILYFSTTEGKPYYLYKPLNMGQKEFNIWSEAQIELLSNNNNNNNSKTWIKNIYWKLEERSCVLVVRNIKWFHDNIHQIESIWNIIKRERIEGYEHRGPNKRVKKNIEEPVSLGCLLCKK